MATSLSTEYIDQYLQQGTEQAQQLMKLLQDERHILSSNDGAALEAVTDSKQQLAQTIQASTRICSQLLDKAGFGNDARSLSNYIQSCAEPHASKFKVTWEKLQSILKQCQDENRINGKLINSSQRRIKEALSIIQGQPVEEDLYDRGGETVNQSSGNSLTHA